MPQIVGPKSAAIFSKQPCIKRHKKAVFQNCCTIKLAISTWMIGTLEYRINGGGGENNRGLEMVRYNNNWGGGGCLAK